MKYIWLFVILLCGCAGQSFFNVQADYRNVLNLSGLKASEKEFLFSPIWGHGMDLPLFRIVSEWQEVFPVPCLWHPIMPWALILRLHQWLLTEYYRKLRMLLLKKVISRVG